MKTKIVISIFSFLVFLILPSISFATSGACSSHGGVNCSVSNSYKSVVCNDGTSDSSTSYADLQECKAVTTCDSGSVTAFTANRGLSGSSFGQSASATCESINNSLPPISLPSVIPSYLKESKTDYVNRKMIQYCTDKYGSNSNYDPVNISCKCNTGYRFSEDKMCKPEKEVVDSFIKKNLIIELESMPEYKGVVDIDKIVGLSFLEWVGGDGGKVDAWFLFACSSDTYRDFTFGIFVLCFCEEEVDRMFGIFYGVRNLY
jgi:hypothetical protein